MKEILVIIIVIYIFFIIPAVDEACINKGYNNVRLYNIMYCEDAEGKPYRLED